MVRDMHDPTAVLADELCRFVIGREVRLKIPRLFDGNRLIEIKAEKRLRLLEHVAVGIRFRRDSWNMTAVTQKCTACPSLAAAA